MIFEFLQIFFENVTRPSTNGSYTRSLYKHMSLLSPWSSWSPLSLLRPLTRTQWTGSAQQTRPSESLTQEGATAVDRPVIQLCVPTEP